MAKSKSRRQHEKETLDISKGTEERIRRRAYELHLEGSGIELAGETNYGRRTRNT